QELQGAARAEQQVAAALKLRELALKAGEEDLRSALRKRDHAVLKQERETEAMEKAAEQMAQRAELRAQELSATLQQRGRQLALESAQREEALQAREAELRALGAAQLEEVKELQRLRRSLAEAETSVATWEADQVHREVQGRVLMLEAKSRDTQLGFLVGGFESERLVVTQVLSGSWGEQKGLKPGLELSSLDGKDVKELKEPEVLEALLSTRPLKLCFLRNPPVASVAAAPVIAAAMAPAVTPAIAPAVTPAIAGADQEFWRPTETQAEPYELVAEDVSQLGLDLTGAWRPVFGVCEP
ncbi:unnamed protein product, partial [Effrenium voratum]